MISNKYKAKLAKHCINWKIVIRGLLLLFIATEGMVIIAERS